MLVSTRCAAVLDSSPTTPKPRSHSRAHCKHCLADARRVSICSSKSNSFPLCYSADNALLTVLLLTADSPSLPHSMVSTRSRERQQQHTNGHTPQTQQQTARRIPSAVEQEQQLQADRAMLDVYRKQWQSSKGFSHSVFRQVPCCTPVSRSTEEECVSWPAAGI